MRITMIRRPRTGYGPYTALTPAVSSGLKVVVEFVYKNGNMAGKLGPVAAVTVPLLFPAME